MKKLSPSSTMSSALSRTLVSTRGSWWVLAAVTVLVALLFALVPKPEADSANTIAPTNAESSRVANILKTFPEADEESVMIVASDRNGSVLGADQHELLSEVADDLGGKGQGQSSPEGVAAEVSGPILSEDGAAAILMVPIEVGASNTETGKVIDGLRETIRSLPSTEELSASGVSLLVTGGPAFGADIASAFSGADFTLLIVTVFIVALLLIITYRSPILWLLPLAVISIADGLAGTLTRALGSALDLQFDAGIISVLVFGAGANYALLFISRYREELSRETDHRRALAQAWTKTASTIIASNLTVVLSLLSLILAVIPGTRGLGYTAALGLIVAALAVLFALPPVLAICGKKVFWPFVPNPGAEARVSNWRRIATAVTASPWRSLGGSVLVLGIMSVGLVGTSVGLDQTEKFRVPAESADGFEVLSSHYPPGESQPIWIVSNASEKDEVARAAADVDGVVRATPDDESTDGKTASIMAVGEFEPTSEAGLELVDDLREALHEVDGAQALVGGGAAEELDSRVGNHQDLVTIVPVILAISLVVLLLVLRAPLAAIVLLIVNATSAVAAIGAGAALSRVFFDQPALDAQVPILAFLFLVALGIDYSIFLSHRAKKEVEVLGARQGIIEAISHTGGVITSAGIVLAGVFAALGMLPLVVLGQLGLIVGIGVLIDTIVVRTFLVPAIFTLIGPSLWWPGRLPAREFSASNGQTPNTIR